MVYISFREKRGRCKKMNTFLKEIDVLTQKQEFQSGLGVFVIYKRKQA